MSELKKTKCNKTWISWNHGKFNEIQKILLRNAKIKQISNFGLLQNSENILSYQKPLMLLMKLSVIGKIYFTKLFVLEHDASTWIQSYLAGSFCDALFESNLSLSS